MRDEVTIIFKNKQYYKDVIIVFTDISVDCLLNPMMML